MDRECGNDAGRTRCGECGADWIARESWPDRIVREPAYGFLHWCANLHFAWFAGELPRAEIAEVRRRFRLDETGDNQ